MLGHVQGGLQVALGLRVGVAAGQPRQIELHRRQGAANVVVYFAGNIGPFALYAGLQVLGQVGQAALGLGQRLGSLLLGAAGTEHIQRALQHHGQPVQAVLVHIVAHAAHHGLGHGGLANGARDQHKRDLLAALAQRLPGVQTGKTAQVVVRQHGIERPVLQRRLEVGQGVHQLQGAVQITALQGHPDEFVVGLVVFQVEDSQARAVGVGGQGHGGLVRYQMTGILLDV